MIILCVILALVCVFLGVKLFCLQRGIDEVCEEFQEKMEEDTNTLITVSGGDRRVRRLAAQINGQLRLLRKERRTLQNGDLELKEAVTNISHDLRTPLTAICGYLDLLEREEKSKNVNRYLKMIRDRSEALKKLTEELFRYSVITSEKDIVLEEVISNRVLEECVSVYYGALKKGGIVPEITIPEEKIVRMLDQDALSRVLGNVVSNAIKYSQGDLEITLTSEGEMIFSNQAPLLDEVQVGRLFERFYTVTSAAKSTGLGLSSARTLTESMGGEITAQYVQGKLCIRVFFPENGD